MAKNIFCWEFLTLWLPNKIFRNFSVIWHQINFSVSHPWHQMKFFGFSLVAPNKMWRSTFSLTTDRMILFPEKSIGPMQKCCISFSTRWWKQHLDSTNSTPYKNSGSKIFEKISISYWQRALYKISCSIYIYFFKYLYRNSLKYKNQSI